MDNGGRIIHRQVDGTGEGKALYIITSTSCSTVRSRDFTNAFVLEAQGLETPYNKRFVGECGGGR